MKEPRLKTEAREEKIKRLEAESERILQALESNTQASGELARMQAEEQRDQVKAGINKILDSMNESYLILHNQYKAISWKLAVIYLSDLPKPENK